jgi:hypothetical protein
MSNYPDPGSVSVMSSNYSDPNNTSKYPGPDTSHTPLFMNTLTPSILAAATMIQGQSPSSPTSPRNPFQLSVPRELEQFQQHQQQGSNIYNCIYVCMDICV